VIWIHCGAAAEAAMTLSLVHRMSDHLPAQRILLTTETGLEPMLRARPPGVHFEPLPADTPAKARNFLDKHDPSRLIWIGGAPHSSLLRAVEKQRITATLVNARSSDLFPSRTGWLSATIRRKVSAFSEIMTADGATATRLTRAGVEKSRVTATGSVLEEPTPTPHNAAELTEMALAVGTRPLWFAADVTASEIAKITDAHLAASRKSHRLLLVLNPRGPNDADRAITHLRDKGLKVGVRSHGDDPETEHQVYIADLPREIGLWCRLAPLTYIGGTMNGGSLLSPFDPIALGSAVVHGTIKTPHEDRYARLDKAQACREIRTTAELGVAIGALISPEQTARMALAGWEEITRNAESINALVHSCVEMLEGTA